MGWTLFDLADLTSYHLETSATVSAQTPGGAAGLIARFGGPGNFYLLTVDGAGTPSVQLWSDGQPVTLQAEQAVVNPAGQANRLAVEDDGIAYPVLCQSGTCQRDCRSAAAAGPAGHCCRCPRPHEAATVDFDWIAIYQPE